MNSRPHSIGRLVVGLGLALGLASTGFASVPALAEDVDYSGIYEITSVASGKDLDISGGNMANCTNIQQYEANSTFAQLWRIEKSGDHYTIKNSVYGKSLDIQNGSKASGANVQLYESNGTAAQLWDIVPTQDGKGFTIVSVLSGNVLDVSGASNSNGANVWAYSSNSSSAQKWELHKVEKTVDDGIYTISSGLSSSKALDVNAGSQDNGAKVQLWDSNKTLAQKWAVSYNNASGLYTIRCARSGKSLDIPGASSAWGLGIQQYDPNGTPAQLWRLVRNDDGTITFRSACSGAALDVDSASTRNGAKIQTWGSNGSGAQKWSFDQVSLSLTGLYTFQSVNSSNAVLDVNSASMATDAKVQVWSPNGSMAQKWRVQEQDDGTYTIKCANSGKFLADNNGTLNNVQEVSDSSKWTAGVGVRGGFEFCNVATGRMLDLNCGSTSAGTVVQTWWRNGLSPQSWKLVGTDLVAEGCYTVSNRANGKVVLDVQGGSPNNCAPVQAYNSNDSDAQKWFVQKNGDGWYKILNVGSNKSLNVKNADPSLKTVQQYEFDGTDACLWRFSIGPNGGVQLISKLGDYALAIKGDSATSGTPLTLTEPGSASTCAWSFSETSYLKEVQNIWGDASYTEQMRQKAAKWGSVTRRPTGAGYIDGKDTGWACTLDIDKARVCVFHKSGSKWVLVNSFNACVGRYNDWRGSKSNTVSGVWSVMHKAYDLYDDQASRVSCARWWTCFYESWTDQRQTVGDLVNRWYPGKGYDDGQGFHWVSGKSSTHDTMGCTGLELDDAKWIYDNVPIGSAVVAFAPYDNGAY